MLVPAGHGNSPSPRVDFFVCQVTGLDYWGGSPARRPQTGFEASLRTLSSHREVSLYARLCRHEF